jgi:hypothetical protein
MLNDKQQKELLKLFTDIETSYEENLKKTEQALIDLEDEQSLSNVSEPPANEPLKNKIKEFEKGKAALTDYIERLLKPKLTEPHLEYAETRKALEKDVQDEKIVHNSIVMMPNK